MKKGLSAFALAAFVGLVACAPDDEAVVVEEEPPIDQESIDQEMPGIPPETDRSITDTMLGPDSAGEVMDTSLSVPPPR